MQITIDAPAPFTLDTIRGFQCGLFEASRCAVRDTVKLAFPLDDNTSIAGVSLRHEQNKVMTTVYGTTKLDLVQAQLRRILCLDHDGDAFANVLASDPVLHRESQSRPGFRPVLFYSTYAAGGWALLTHRWPKARAASLAKKIAVEGGDTVDVDGETLASFPRPQTILARANFPGVPDEKWLRLRTLAQAALDGALEIGRVSRERLLKLRGVGPWTADAVLIRGVGPTDVLPVSEPLLEKAVSEAYGSDDVETISQRWRPFRTWVSILLIMNYMRKRR
jgi:DNA-3-methyladenine glycosylase II